MAGVDEVMLPRSRWGRGLLLAVALGFGAIAWLVHLPMAPSFEPFLAGWFAVVDPLIGLLCIAGVALWMPRHPLAIGGAIVASAVVSESSGGVALLVVGLIATRRRWREIAVFVPAGTLALYLSGSQYPSSASLNWWAELTFSALSVIAVAAIGFSVGQRRALLAGLRERAVTAERERESAARVARAEERNRIAHDMHDVLAHRISLVSLHASVLEYRPDLTEVERTAAVEAIAENARAALGELSDVLGVLHDPAGTAEAPAAPVRGVADVPALVDESRAAGDDVSLRSELDGVPPLLASQTAYRVIREALTNARKHALGAAVTVAMVGEPGEGLALRIVNDAGTSADLPGSGLGLVGIRAAVDAAGGRFEARSDEAGGFVVSAWLPWGT